MSLGKVGLVAQASFQSGGRQMKFGHEYMLHTYRVLLFCVLSWDESTERRTRAEEADARTS